MKEVCFSCGRSLFSLPDPVSEVRASGTISGLFTLGFLIARDFAAFFFMPKSYIFPKVP